ncbi:MAG: AzlD domain-containing protein, partial [Armatimonadota bacterium]
DRVAMPDVIRRALRFVPPAVLSALVVPALLAPDPVRHMAIDYARLIAGVLAAVVAWHAKNVFLTIGVGMGLMWILQSFR